MLQRVGHDSVTEHTHTQFVTSKCFNCKSIQKMLRRTSHSSLRDSFCKIQGDLLMDENPYFKPYVISYFCYIQ